MAEEAEQIRDLLGRKVAAKRPQQKDLRDQMRAIGFYSSDWRGGGAIFTVSDFDALVESGQVRIGDGDATLDSVDTDWFLTVIGEVFPGRPPRPRSSDPVGAEVLVDDWATLQRIALGRTDETLALCAWPGEQKPQARGLYGGPRVQSLLAFLDRHQEWEGRPTPHLAYNNSKRADRLYMTTEVPAEQYLERWSEPDAFEKIGGHAPETVRDELWPWLRDQGFADPMEAEDGRLDGYMDRLERRRDRAHLRPGIELRRSWDWREAVAADPELLVGELKETARELLDALGEPMPSEPG